MLGKKGIPPILEQLQTLADNRIAMHTQIVLCPGLNDGVELERTVADLAALFPAVGSLAVVPLGLTRHRERLPQLTAVDADYARAFITEWEPRARALAKRLGESFLFLADEFYLKAGLPFPPVREYGDFPQIENGVGMAPLFLKEAAAVLKAARPVGTFRATVVTGLSAAGFVGDFLAELGSKTGLDLQLAPVPNRLFGESVTVSGLVAGNDILHALQGVEIGQVLLVPEVMLKEGEGVFLDDVRFADLAVKLGCRVETFDGTPRGFYQTLRRISRQLR